MPSAFLSIPVSPIFLSHYPSKSLPFNSFADPHPLNLYATIFYKNTGRGAPLQPQSLRPRRGLGGSGVAVLTSLHHYLIISPLQGIMGTTIADGCALS